jgi:hypothetical protein
MENTSHNLKYLAMSGLVLAALIITGCASVVAPPTDQIAITKMAVSNAVNAGGTEFAPAEMRAARDKLELAIKAMTEEKYEKAKLLAEQAEVDAQLATSKAHSAKAEKAANTVQEDSRVLHEELNRQ